MATHSRVPGRATPKAHMSKFPRPFFFYLSLKHCLCLFIRFITRPADSQTFHRHFPVSPLGEPNLTRFSWILIRRSQELSAQVCTRTCAREVSNQLPLALPYPAPILSRQDMLCKESIHILRDRFVARDSSLSIQCTTHFPFVPTKVEGQNESISRVYENSFHESGNRTSRRDSWSRSSCIAVYHLNCADFFL